MSGWRMALLLLAGVSYALLSHWMMVQHTLAPWAVLLLLAPLLLGGSGVAVARFGPLGWLALPLLGAGAVLLALHGGGDDVPRLYLLQHSGMHLLLAAWFGGTLRAGHVPLISQLATRVRGCLSGNEVRYTRRVTQVWTAYFLAMAMVSPLVYYSLPFAAWAFLDNLLTPLCMGLLFVGEHLLRYQLHPEFERVSIAATVQAFRRESAHRARP